MILYIAITILALISAFLGYLCWKYKISCEELTVKVKEFRQLFVKYGEQVEAVIPFMKGKFPYDRKRFYALGQPIDGIFFGDDEIVFLEFKSGKAGLKSDEKKFKELVDNKKVRFDIIRID